MTEREPVSKIRMAQDAEAEMLRRRCAHSWNAAPFVGVVIGLTICQKCGTTSREADFTRLQERSSP